MYSAIFIFLDMRCILNDSKGRGYICLQREYVLFFGTCIIFAINITDTPDQKMLHNEYFMLFSISHIIRGIISRCMRCDLTFSRRWMLKLRFGMWNRVVWYFATVFRRNLTLPCSWKKIAYPEGGGSRFLWNVGIDLLIYTATQKNLRKKNSMALVRKRTTPTERPLLVVEVSANFCG
jgi:hypothetical protein